MRSAGIIIHLPKVGNPPIHQPAPGLSGILVEMLLVISGPRVGLESRRPNDRSRPLRRLSPLRAMIGHPRRVRGVPVNTVVRAHLTLLVAIKLILVHMPATAVAIVGPSRAVFVIRDVVRSAVVTRRRVP